MHVSSDVHPGRLGDYICVLLAGEQPHDVPVAGENSELHQVSKHTQNLQEELLQIWE